MGIPSGEVVARPLVTRACGCQREFQHFAKDRYREQRLAKFQKTRCEVCVAKMNETRRPLIVSFPRPWRCGYTRRHVRRDPPVGRRRYT